MVLGPFLLTGELLPLLRPRPAARVCSGSRAAACTRSRSTSTRSRWGARRLSRHDAYARAKRAQVVLAEEWAKRLREDRIVVHACIRDGPTRLVSRRACPASARCSARCFAPRGRRRHDRVARRRRGTRPRHREVLVGPRAPLDHEARAVRRRRPRNARLLWERRPSTTASRVERRAAMLSMQRLAWARTLSGRRAPRAWSALRRSGRGRAASPRRHAERLSIPSSVRGRRERPTLRVELASATRPCGDAPRGTAPRARAPRRGRSRRAPVGACRAHRLGVEPHRRDGAGQRRAARARACRRRRTPAPCPPGGRGGSRAAGRSTAVDGDEVAGDASGLARARARPCRGSASAASCSTRSSRPRRARPSRAPRRSIGRGRPPAATGASRRSPRPPGTPARSRGRSRRRSSSRTPLERRAAPRSPRGRGRASTWRARRRRAATSTSALRPLREPLEVAEQRPRVRQQMVAERDGCAARACVVPGITVSACSRARATSALDELATRPSMRGPPRAATGAGRSPRGRCGDGRHAASRRRRRAAP